MSGYLIFSIMPSSRIYYLCIKISFSVKLLFSFQFVFVVNVAAVLFATLSRLPSAVHLIITSFKKQQRQDVKICRQQWTFTFANLCNCWTHGMTNTRPPGIISGGERQNPGRDERPSTASNQMTEVVWYVQNIATSSFFFQISGFVAWFTLELDIQPKTA